ncbi:MAG: F-type H+-transporting ATPase subunit delta [Humisphaera sp.]|nr:F-type H+-transporting ATPase subunit delta [Humisphaera sp.]
MAKHRSEQHASPTAVTYAQSILELANDQKQAEPIGQELAALKQILDENPSIREIFTNPSISADERGKLLERAFKGKIAPLLYSTIGVLNAHNRLGLLTQIAQAYDDLLDKQLGKVEVDLTVAQKLDAAQLEQARKQISAALGRHAVIHQYVDDGIIGGMIVRVGDKLIDSSVRYQLAAMKKQLLESAPK